MTNWKIKYRATQLICITMVLGTSTPALLGQQTATISNHPCSGPKNSIAGTVTDATGARLPFATVHVACGTLVEETTTNERGAYHLSLPPGSFALEVRANGYVPKEGSLQISGQSLQEVAPVALSVASTKSSVTVTAEGGMTASLASTSTKIETPILEQPFSISTITQDQLVQQNPQSMVETLAYTAGA